MNGTASSLAAWFGFAGFAWPWWLLMLPLPWLVRWLLPPARSHSDALRVPYGERLQFLAAHRPGPAPRGGLLLIWPSIAWVLLCIAAARPQQLGEVVQPPQAGRDLMLALDLSGSMDQPDMTLGNSPVSRLTAAKAVIADFLERRSGDRVGLIAFGDRAYALTPLTRDLNTVREQLDATVVGLTGRETAIGDAIGLAAKRLQQQPTEHRVLILLTDGVNTAGSLDPVKAAELARDVGVRIYTIALGSDGSKLSLFGIAIPLPGGGGDSIDETGLRKIAAITGGRSFRARDSDELAGIYVAIDRLEPIKRPGQRLRPRIERYPLPLTLSFGCVLILIFLLLWRRSARA